MKTILLKGEVRNNLGKAATKSVRVQGMVPCILYGNKDTENLNFSIYHSDFKNLVYTPNTYRVRLDIDSNQYEAILQDLQFHPVSEAIIHADFIRINENNPVTVDIPVQIVGESKGVREGGKLRLKLKKLRVKGLIKDLPEFIEVSINGLLIGQSVKVESISVEGLELLDAPANAIVSVKTARVLAVLEDEEEEGVEGEGAEGEGEGEGEAAGEE
jgi:large subunit ribosomal protein L25